MLMTDVTGEPIVILKTDPEDSKALQEKHDDITAGYHMNKKHWVTLHPSGDLQTQLIEDLVTESYLLVVENLPKAERPVDPCHVRAEQSVTLSGARLQQIARDTAGSLDDVSHGHPFTPHLDVWKVHDSAPSFPLSCQRSRWTMRARGWDGELHGSQDKDAKAASPVGH